MNIKDSYIHGDLAVVRDIKGLSVGINAATLELTYTKAEPLDSNGILPIYKLTLSDFAGNLASKFVTLDTAQTVSGKKTFSNGITVKNGLLFDKGGTTTNEETLHIDGNVNFTGTNGSFTIKSTQAWAAFRGIVNNTYVGYLGINSTNEPVYISADLTAVRKLIHDGNYTSYTPLINGTHAKSITSIYAPIDAGLANQILVSSGTGAPTWQTVNSGSTSGTFKIGNTEYTIKNIVTTDTAQTITGVKIFNTDTTSFNTSNRSIIGNPVVISRYGSKSQALHVGVDDSVAYFIHQQDETVANFAFIGTWTDTEGTNTGTKAGYKRIDFILNLIKDPYIAINGNKVYHEGSSLYWANIPISLESSKTTSPTFNSLTIGDNNDSKHILFSRAGLNYVTIPTNGTFAVSVNSASESATRLTVDNSNVCPGLTNKTVNLGTLSYPWNNVYAAKFIKSGATDGNNILLANGDDISQSLINSGTVNTWSPKYWESTIKCATWSRLCYITKESANIGSSFILNIRATRSNIVYNNTYLISVYHSSRANVVCLNASNYSDKSLIIRCDVNGSGDCYVALYDDQNNATNSTNQTVLCALYPVRCGNITTYNTFADDTTIESGFTATELVTENKSITSNSIKSRFYHVDNSSNDYMLLGGGGTKKLSDFLTVDAAKNEYVKLSDSELTITSTIGSYEKGVINFYRKDKDISFIGFSNNNSSGSRLQLGSIGFDDVNTLKFRNTDGNKYVIYHANNLSFLSPILKWGEAQTVAKVDKTDVNITLPTNPVNTNTDQYVTQNITTSSDTSWRPLILGFSYNDNATFNPSTVINTTYSTHLAKFKPNEGILAIVGLKKMTKDKTIENGSNNEVFNTNGGTTTLTSYATASSLYWANLKISTSATYNTEPMVKSVTISNNTTNTLTNSATMQYNSTTKSIDFIFN